MTAPLHASIGARLRRLREERGVSPSQIGSIGISHRRLIEYEAGQAPIGASMLLRLAECLGVEVGEFFRHVQETPEGGET